MLGTAGLVLIALISVHHLYWFDNNDPLYFFYPLSLLPTIPLYSLFLFHSLPFLSFFQFLIHISLSFLNISLFTIQAILNGEFILGGNCEYEIVFIREETSC